MVGVVFFENQITDFVYSSLPPLRSTRISGGTRRATSEASSPYAGPSAGAEVARLRKWHAVPVSVKKHSSGEEDMWENKLSELRIGGCGAVSAAASPGKGWHKKGWIGWEGSRILYYTILYYTIRYCIVIL